MHRIPGHDQLLIEMCWCRSVAPGDGHNAGASAALGHSAQLLLNFGLGLNPVQPQSSLAAGVARAAEVGDARRLAVAAPARQTAEVPGRTRKAAANKTTAPAKAQTAADAT